jgi:CDP-paratose 2-epimerase
VKLLVTGGEGFLGSHVCAYYAKKGWQVLSIDNRTKFELSRIPYINPYVARKYMMDYLTKLGTELIVGDICNAGALIDIASKYKPDYIIHCAAQPAMTISLESPTMSCQNNVLGTVNVLEVAHKLKVPVAICSTIHVYGNGDNKNFDNLIEGEYAYNEDDSLLTGSITPLHADKISCENYARAFIESYESKVAIFRLSGIYGDAQWGGEDHAWTANFGWRTVLNMPIKIFGTDKQIRDIVYADDVVKAFDLWFENGQSSGIYNIGGGIQCKTSLRGCLNYQSQLSGKTQDIEIAPYRKGDLWYFICDISKAKEIFSWQPEILPYEGLKRQLIWIQDNLKLTNGDSK